MCFFYVIIQSIVCLELFRANLAVEVAFVGVFCEVFEVSCFGREASVTDATLVGILSLVTHHVLLVVGFGG